MPVKQALVDNEYGKNKGLKREDVKSLQEWAKKQPHLPPLTELQIILFLHSCYYSNEAAKNTIDKFFSVKNVFPELFKNRDPTSAALRAAMNVCLVAPLPKLTPEGYRVVYFRCIDLDPDHYIYTEQLKLSDMVASLWANQEGTDEGHVMVLDHENLTFAHMTKIGLMPTKKFLFYLQEAMPVRIKGLHIINTAPFIDKLMAMIKPFMKKDLMDILYLHPKIDTLFKHVPQECLPDEYGGKAGSFAQLHEIQNTNLLANAAYFLQEEQQCADDSKRLSKPKDVGDVFGMEGTFKKLTID